MIVAVVVDGTLVVVTGKVADVDPPGMNTVPGTVTAGLLEAS